MSALAKGIAVLLIVMAVVSTAYTANFASEYSSSLSALADFSAYMDMDIENMKYSEEYDVHYFLVNITFVNPSGVDVQVYEVNMAAFLMNSTTGEFTRTGNPSSCFCEYPPMTVHADSEITKTFYLSVDDFEDMEWNAEHSPDGKAFLDPYMEVRYRVADYGFVNMYIYGFPHSPCSACGGRGPFD